MLNVSSFGLIPARCRLVLLIENNSPPGRRLPVSPAETRLRSSQRRCPDRVGSFAARSMRFQPAREAPSILPAAAAGANASANANANASANALPASWAFIGLPCLCCC